MTADNAQRWVFCDNETAKELGQQLADGLIHPLEYSNAVHALADSIGWKINS